MPIQTVTTVDGRVTTYDDQTGRIISQSAPNTSTPTSFPQPVSSTNQSNPANANTSTPQTSTNTSGIGNEAPSEQVRRYAESHGISFNQAYTELKNAGNLLGAGTTKSDSEMNANIDALLEQYPTLTLDQKALLKQFASMYTGANTDTAEILKTFNTIKSSTIDPYFYSLTNAAISDVTKSKQQLENARRSELETEGITAKENIKNTQNNLEASGLTFSGEAENQLGNKSAYTGDLPEGLVNTSSRLMSTGNQARFDVNMRELARQYENQQGSTAAGQIFDPTNLAGGISNINSTTGQQKSAMESNILNSLTNQYKAKQQLLTNQ